MSQLVTLQLTEADQQLLLQIARDAIRAYLAGQKPSLPKEAGRAISECRGTFVSLQKGHELRGCIGNIHAVSPLYRSVAVCAIAAAVSGPRFIPLPAAELPAVEVEISVVSLLERVLDVRQIEIGKHGLLISKNNARGLLLPQVATTFGWNTERFLQETCKKAGLKPDDWKQNATIESFSELVLSE